MSTRCNITLSYNDTDEKLWFYRHCDGYPEGALPLLSAFMQAVANGDLRDNPGQSGGWLIALGMAEYNTEVPEFDPSIPFKEYQIVTSKNPFLSWKVGAIEPTTGKHGDIEYLYEVTLSDRTIKVFEIHHYPSNYERTRKRLIQIIKFERNKDENNK